MSSAPRRCSVAAVLLAAAALAAGRPDAPPPAGAGPDLGGSTQSVHVPFAVAAGKGPVDFGDLRSMHVRVSIDGRPPISLEADTGSVGIIVSAAEVPHVDPHGEPGQMIYSSSGLEFDGVWTPVTVAFVDARDADGRVPTATIPVLATQERKVIPGAINGGRAKPMKNPKLFMCGMGFGRGKDPHPERNPFLNLAAMQAGTMRRGYTITRDGFTLGLTADTAGPGYVYQKLKGRDLPAGVTAGRPGLKDWESSRGSVTVGGRRQPETAVLIDTGITNMLLPSAAVAENTDVPAGTPVAVDLLGGLLHYSFTAGNPADPAAAKRVTWFPAKPTSNINTGLRALADFDYLYDADGGYLGLRPAHGGR